MAAVPEVGIEVDPKNYDGALRDVLEVVRPAWKRDDIHFKFLVQGYMNHVLACYIDEDNKNDWIVARIFGTDIEFGQQRDVEIRNSKLYAEREIGPPVYGIFKNGLLFKFMTGKTYSWTDVISAFRDIKLCKAVAREMANIHCEKSYKLAIEKYDIHQAKRVEDIFEEMLTKPWPDVIIDEETTKWFTSEVPPMEERLREVRMLLERFKDDSITETFCHGDFNPTNVIYDEDNDKVTMIDFESSSISYPTYDFSAFFSTAASGLTSDPEGMMFSPEFKRDFLYEYLRERNRLDGGPGEVDERLLAKYAAMVEVTEICMNYFWFILSPMMALAPPRHGHDNKFFLRFALGRLQYYNRHRERMLAITIPK
ncbi:ethanolamine kinase 2-like [Lineus longissimus]|uniref:ethanolamine kinase 2-like n=1 Tax=Lineus longissimus TaxID=88925 RepID=UPI00315CE42C